MKRLICRGALLSFAVSFLCARIAASQPVFGDRTDHVAGLGPVSIDAADVDGDGDLDLVSMSSCLSCGSDHSLSVLRNDGAGNYPTLVPPSDKIALTFWPGPPCLADLDFDGDVDIALGADDQPFAGGNRTVILINDGTGGFAEGPNYPTGLWPSDIACGDFDSDGDLDLAVANRVSNNVVIMINQGGMTFVAGGTYVTCDMPRELAVADYDGDTDLDIAVTHEASSELAILFNDGNAGFVSGPCYPAVGMGAVSASDLDLDGDRDLVATVRGGPDSMWVSVLINDGSGVFGSAQRHSVGAGPNGLTLADFNLDGCIDIATSNYFTYDVSVLMNDCSAGFLPHVDYSMETPPYGPFGICSADLDRDGDADLAVANYNPGKVQVLRNLHCGAVFTPCTFDAQDCNCDHVVDVLDVTCSVDAAFRGGDPRPPCCRFE